MTRDTDANRTNLDFRALRVLGRDIAPQIEFRFVNRNLVAPRSMFLILMSWRRDYLIERAALMKFALISSALLALLLPTGEASSQDAGMTPVTRTQPAVGLDRVPSFDVKPSCRAPASQALESLHGCQADEQDARQQLSREWNTFSSSDRTNCTGLTEGFDPSYVELLSCLEMRRDAKSNIEN